MLQHFLDPSTANSGSNLMQTLVRFTTANREESKIDRSVCFRLELVYYSVYFQHCFQSPFFSSSLTEILVYKEFQYIWFNL